MTELLPNPSEKKILPFQITPLFCSTSFTKMSNRTVVLKRQPIGASVINVCPLPSQTGRLERRDEAALVGTREVLDARKHDLRTTELGERIGAYDVGGAHTLLHGGSVVACLAHEDISHLRSHGVLTGGLHEGMDLLVCVRVCSTLFSHLQAIHQTYPRAWPAG